MNTWGTGDGWDFFVSYTAADHAWAEWIAWQLEAAGYRVLIQAWDFVPGAHWMGRMADGVRGSHQVIAVLSHAYLGSVYGKAEWEAAFRADPAGQTRKIIPIRIQDCPRPVLLDAVVSFDLFDLDQAQAHTRLLESVTAAVNGRAKPTTAPAFPGTRALIPPTTSPATSPPPTFPTHTTVDWTRPLSLGRALTAHTDRVWAVAFSPDGRTLATGSHDKTVRLWEVSDPARPTPLGRPLQGHPGWVWAVAFSPDGRTLATGTTTGFASVKGAVRLWDVSDPARPTPLGRPLQGHTGAVWAVAFSPDGRTLAAGTGTGTRFASVKGAVWLWEVSDPTDPTLLGRTLTSHTGWVRSMAFSPGWSTLATASNDKTARLLEVSDPARPTLLGRTLTSHTGWVNSVAFSPDGRTLATGSDDATVRLWEVSGPAHPTPLGRPLQGHTNAVLSVVFSPDGRTLATGSNDKTVRLWEVSDPAHPTPLGQPFTAHTGAVFSVVFSPDGRTLATASNDKTVRLWQAG